MDHTKFLRKQRNRKSYARSHHNCFYIRFNTGLESAADSFKRPGNIDVNIVAGVPVWKSDDRNHQISLTGSCTGTLCGGSNSDKRFGAGFTFPHGK